MKTLTLPKGSPDPLPELAAFLAPFAPLFRRATSHRSLERYVTGLLTDLPRKNCETIAQSVVNTSLEQLQHLLTDAAWDPLALDEQRVRLLVEQSPPKGVLVLDDTGLPKQGQASVGVQHQYSGTLGKEANCQIVVSAQSGCQPTSRSVHQDQDTAPAQSADGERGEMNVSFFLAPSQKGRIPGLSPEEAYHDSGL